MKRPFLLFLAVLALAACNGKKKESARLMAARCLSNDACPAGETCDVDTQTCVDLCAGTACAVDQIAVNDGTVCTCVNTDGIGSPCIEDGDCASPTPFAGSQHQVCRALASPPPGWPAGKFCVPDVGCTVSPPSCPDPSTASAQIEAACIPLSGSPAAACSTACVNGSGPTTTVTPCRFDQIPQVGTGGVCTCVARPDPFGDLCTTSDVPCPWPTGLLGNAGPTRLCKAVTGGGRRCVPVDFCAKDETPVTCVNRVDDDCDGIADGDEAACLIEHCSDLDEDQYCQMMTCNKRRPQPGDRPRSACFKAEFKECDQPGMHTINPGIPEQCNGIDDNCDSMRTVDEGCQAFCFDGDDDAWTTAESRVVATAPPSSDWNTCSPPHEHPTCDTDPSRHQETPCGPPPVVVVEPPKPLRIVLRMRNVDDEAYAWLDGGPKDKTQALCATSRGRPDFDCDLMARFVERGRTTTGNLVSVMILNSGCGNAQGWFELLVNDEVKWSSHENPDVRHCGWVFRHSFVVHPVTGQVNNGTWESCAWPHDCP